MREELKPCPFCGGNAEAVHEIDDLWATVECTGCGASVDGIAAWNARAERTCRNASLDNSQFYCSMCECTVVMPLLWGDLKYCPGCGARVERGDA